MSEIQECVLYRGMEHGEILLEMAKLMDALSDDRKDPDSLKPVFFRCVGELVEMAGAYGFSGNLWHDYLTLLLVNHENAFSTACEIRGAVGGRSLPFMILRYSGTCMPLTLPLLTDCFIHRAAGSSAAIRRQRTPGKCLTGASETGSVI